jgi:hypothetical protein
MSRAWDAYWAWTGGNIGAMPLQALITIAVTLIFLRPLKRAWRKTFGERADIGDIRRAAEAAHRIAADLHERMTGEAHPDAPARRESEGK